jgi:hypothetical protein
MENWYSPVRAPLIARGAFSEMYNGTATEAIPTPTPATTLYREISHSTLVDYSGMICTFQHTLPVDNPMMQPASQYQL